MLKPKPKTEGIRLLALIEVSKPTSVVPSDDLVIKNA